MCLEFALLQGGYAHGRRLQEALRPMSQEDLVKRQLTQAASMQAMALSDIAQRYGLMNAWQPDQSSGDK